MKVIRYERYLHETRSSTTCFCIPDEKVMIQFPNYSHSSLMYTSPSYSFITEGPCYEEAQRVADGNITLEETIVGHTQVTIQKIQACDYPTEKVKRLIENLKAQEELDKKVRDLGHQVHVQFKELSESLK